MKSLSAVGCLVLSVVSMLAVLTGCENSSGPDGLTLTPSAATVAYRQTVILEANGGTEYQWSMENEKQGEITPRTGSRVTFRSLYAGSIAPLMQTVTVMSMTRANESTPLQPQELIIGHAVITQLPVLPAPHSTATSTTTTTTVPSSTTTTTTTSSTTTTISDGPPMP